MTENQAKLYAEQLYIAMKKFGTNDDLVTDVYNRVKDDVGGLGLIYNAFGKKKYGLAGSTAKWLGREEDLYEWLRRELPTKKFVYWDALFRQLNRDVS